MTEEDSAEEMPKEVKVAELTVIAQTSAKSNQKNREIKKSANKNIESTESNLKGNKNNKSISSASKN